MNKKFLIALIVFMVIYILVYSVGNFYIDYRWFSIYNHLDIFWILFFSKFNVQTLFWGLFVGLFILNFVLIRILGGKGRIFTKNILDRIRIPGFGTTRNLLFVLLAAGVIVLGFFMGLWASAYWKEYLMYKNAVSFSGFPNDPLFNKDIGFYVFTFPFYKFMFRWLLVSLSIITIFSFFFHILNNGIFSQDGKLEFSRFARAHLSTLMGIIVLLIAAGYRLLSYDLLFNNRAKFFGAGYTDVHAKLLAYDICIVISVIAAILLFVNIITRSFKLPVITLITLLPVYFIFGTIFPGLQQRFIVDPNELEKESPYIKYNIEFTRLAFGLNAIKEMPFENAPTLTLRDLEKNKDVVNNIRLWDWRPLKQTYKQLQGLKPYYDFIDVDIVLYTVNNQKVALNISARELDNSKLTVSKNSWLNNHLIFTHGYGVVASRVDRITPEGLPELVLYDIPPKYKIQIPVELPQIYYGEHNNSYIITNTKVNPGEFDYPYGDENKYTIYNGTGGDVLDSVIKRAMYAIAFGDFNIFISNVITSTSRIHFRRNIAEMIKAITPFLYYDSDPYVVVAGGKIYWIIDGYTSSNAFPYSTPLQLEYGESINYIRNSVKIVIDAYNGSITYYISDPDDPVINAYSKIFKNLFLPIDKMPSELQVHLRYPEGLFNLQAQQLLRYHMTNINVFYNNEDLWEIPLQIYENEKEYMHSYYLVTALPGEKATEFLLILPFTPAKKDNMIGFMVARCDMPYYGQLLLYTLPKDKLNFGPMQIEARINQDAEISKQLTLWSQRGSRVIRGNMLVLPVKDSILFIEPLYLKAETSEMPELKRVIVSYRDKIVMEENLSMALSRLFTEGGGISFDYSSEYGLKDLINKAYMHFIQAEEYQRQGNWAKYGEELKQLKDTLTALRNAR
ncbi:MAG: UPF0182 family protein [Spirochaetota bacterium]|nr:UPF0182 family protein [Spirochaetota bacterium]